MKNLISISTVRLCGVVLTLSMGSIAYSQTAMNGHDGLRFSSASQAERYHQGVEQQKESQRAAFRREQAEIYQSNQRTMIIDTAEFQTEKVGSRFALYVQEEIARSPEKLKLYLAKSGLFGTPSTELTAYYNNMTHSQLLNTFYSHFRSKIDWISFMERLNKTAIFLSTYKEAEKSKAKSPIGDRFEKAATKLDLANVRTPQELQKIADSAKEIASSDSFQKAIETKIHPSGAKQVSYPYVKVSLVGKALVGLGAVALVQGIANASEGQELAAGTIGTVKGLSHRGSIPVQATGTN